MKNKFSIALSLAVILSMLLTSLALADNLVGDGDNATPIVSHSLSLGTVCVDTTTTGNILLGISRQGNYSTAQVFKKDTSATVAVLSPSSGLSAAMDSSPATISIPADWDNASNGTIAGAVSSTVTFVAGSTPGSFSGTVSYRASGTQSDNTTLNRDVTVSVAATVSNTGDCAPVLGDTTPPEISYEILGTLGNNGWYTSNVTLTWTVDEPESQDSLVLDGCEDQNITADQQETTYSCSATSDGGSAGPVEVKIKRDATKPTLNPSVSPNPVLLNGSATASAGADDATSGVASSSCDAVDTSTVGSHSVNCTATDNAGNTNSASATYNVAYNFAGFFQPVDNFILNGAKAGQAIPLKWRLTDANGMPVLNLTSVNVKVGVFACASGTPTDAIEEYAAGSSGLQNLGDGNYQFNWKTLSTYANSCRSMTLDLGDGVLHTVQFQFKK